MLFSDFIADSISSAADTPSKGPEEGSVRPEGSAFQGLAQPEAASPGTYAATATPFQGGSHSILPPTPSIKWGDWKKQGWALVREPQEQATTA